MKTKKKNINKKEINIVVAMKREAMPLIKYWNLKENSKKFYTSSPKIEREKAKWRKLAGFLTAYVHFGHYKNVQNR